MSSTVDHADIRGLGTTCIASVERLSSNLGRGSISASKRKRGLRPRPWPRLSLVPRTVIAQLATAAREFSTA